MEEYIDLRLLLIILVAFISFIVLKVLYKKISFPKLLQVILTLIVILGNVYFIYSYINTLESEYVNTKTEYYVKGKVKFVSNAIDKIRIEYSDTNIVIQDIESDELLVNIKSSTKIYDKSGKKINSNEIKKGDLINVKTSTHSLENGVREINASRIQKY